MKAFVSIIILTILFLFSPSQARGRSVASQNKDTTGQKVSPKISRHPHFKISRSDKKLLKTGFIYFAVGLGLAYLGISGHLVSFIGLLFIVAGQILLVTGLVCMLIGLAGLRWYDS